MLTVKVGKVKHQLNKVCHCLSNAVQSLVKNSTKEKTNSEENNKVKALLKLKFTKQYIMHFKMLCK